MIIALVSAQGGVGRTTVAVNMARALGSTVRLLDCDVETPKAHLFLRGAANRTELFSISVPLVDESRCDGCGKCAAICRHQAIVAAEGAPRTSSPRRRA